MNSDMLERREGKFAIFKLQSRFIGNYQTDQSLQLSRFDDQSHHDKTDQSKPGQRHKHHHLTTTLHLTLKITTAQVVETSVTNNSLSNHYLHPDDHTKPLWDL